MNIGHDLMRRHGPRAAATRGMPGPPRCRHRGLAVAILVGGIAALLALGWSGARSEPSAKLAVALALALVAGVLVDRIVAWVRAPIHEHGSADAGDVLDRLWMPPWLRWTGVLAGRWAESPVRAACMALMVPALLVSLGLARHWKWLPATHSTRGLRGALAPAQPPPPPTPMPGAPSSAPAAPP